MSEALATALAVTADADPLVGATARGLLYGYHARWVNSGWTFLAVEQEYQLPIVNPDTGRSSRTFTQAGKTDGIAARDGKQFLMEHKTCAEDIADPDAPYWRRLAIDSQVSAYTLAHWQSGQALDGTLYDVIRKPGIRPKKLTKDEAKELQTGHYYGQQIPDAIRLDARLTYPGVQECPELFERRLAADCGERADWYFARKVLYRDEQQVLEYARELWAVADEIRLTRLADRHPRNSGACMTWGRPCEYLGICSGFNSPDGWQRADRVHDELASVADGKDVLTHSRLSTFRLCKKKHYYRYELGIRKDEDSESLVFGKLFHEALAAYWSCLKGDDLEHCDNGSAANEAGEPTAATAHDPR